MSSDLLLKMIGLMLVSPFFMAGFCSKSDVPANIPTDATQFFSWNIMGVAGQVSSPKDSLTMTSSNNQTTFSGKTIGSSVTANYRLSFPSTAIGTYSASDCQIYVSGRYFVSTSNPISITISQYGPAGSYIIGTYTGEIKDSTSGKIYSATGDFKIKH